MNDYINQISRYYFKQALNNPAIEKLLEKKELDYKIKAEVIKELDELLEFIGELKNLNFSFKEIKSEIPIFLKQQKYLCNLDEGIIDLYKLKLSEKKETIPIVIANEKNLEINLTEKYEKNKDLICLLDELSLEKDFLFYFTFDEYFNCCKEFIMTFSKYIFNEVSYEDLVTNRPQMQYKKQAMELCQQVETICKKNKISKFNSFNKESFYNKYFSFFYKHLENISAVVKQENNRISYELLKYKEHQKTMRQGGSSFFIGNIYAMGIYGAVKGIGSICSNISDSSDRKKFKNLQEEEVMQNYYTFIDEILEELGEKFKILYELIIFAIITNLELAIDVKPYETLCGLKLEMEKILKNDSFKNKKQLENYLRKYPYSIQLWEKYYKILSLENLKKLEINLIDINAQNLLKILSQIKIEKIIIRSNNLSEINSAIKESSDELVLNLFMKRFAKEISQQDFLSFKEFLKLNEDKVEILIEKNKVLIYKIIKSYLDKEFETFYSDEKINILSQAEDIVFKLENNLLLNYFYNSSQIAKEIGEKYNKYISEVQENQDIEIQKIQNELNKELEILKSLDLNSRNLMKFFVLSDCFNRNISLIEELLGDTVIQETNVCLSWNTSQSLGIITLTRLIYNEKATNKKNHLFFKDIKTVKINPHNNMIIDVETINGEKYEINLFDTPSEEVITAVRGVAIYIKCLSNLWNKISNLCDIYIKDYCEVIDSLYSCPKYLLEFIFNSGLLIERYFKLFLKNGFVNKLELDEYEAKLKKITDLMKLQLKDNNEKIILYPNISTEDKELLIGGCKELLGRKISDEIIAFYLENEDEDEENPSLFILTEKSLFITKNNFGEIPLNKVQKFEVKGFVNQTLEIKFGNQIIKILFSNNEEENVIFSKILQIYLEGK